MSNLVLDAQNIEKSFTDGKSTVDVIKGISLQVKAGEFVSIVGSSGSGKSTLALARAVVTKPKLMMADEPTGNLDRKTADKIFELLTELRSEFNMAMLIVTHDEQLAHSADRILHMRDGLWMND